MWTISGLYNGKLPASGPNSDDEEEKEKEKEKGKEKEKDSVESEAQGSKECKNKVANPKKHKRKDLHFSGVNMVYFKDDRIIEQVRSSGLPAHHVAHHTTPFDFVYLCALPTSSRRVAYPCISTK